MDIVSQMTPVDWMLVMIVLALVAFSIYIVYLLFEDTIKAVRKRAREKKQANQEHLET